MTSSRRRRRGPVQHDNEERWLLTYADMITLLMALFMVLFSISSVNISKFKTLQQALRAAFSGSILPGGKAILQSGAQSTARHTPPTAPVPAIVPLTPDVPKPGWQLQLQTTVGQATAAFQEQADFIALKHRLDAYARAHGFSTQVQTVVERRGLVVRVLTDRLLFESGQAALKPQGLPLLGEVSALLKLDPTHPIIVEGHTDNVPIDTSQFPSNWELSTARASTVVRFLIGEGVDVNRLSAAGYAALRPVASNATVGGRALNRRVEIVLQRVNPPPAQ